MSRRKKKFKTPHDGQAAGKTGMGTRLWSIVFVIGFAALLALWLILTDVGRNGKLRSSEPETATWQKSEETSNVPATTATLDFTESVYGIDMVHVRGGTFLMGCTPEQQQNCYEHEEPGHLVTLSDFYIGKYEVTQAQWKAVMGNTPSVFRGDDLPVENVSWNNAQEFIEKLNAATGKSYRLPTEAEWEYAARGGRGTRIYRYGGSNNVEEIAWYDNNSEGRTHPVGTKGANELGIHDMSGNVWEWVHDWYGNYDDVSKADPKGPEKGSMRIIRGGGWGSYARGVRVSNYFYNAPGNRYNFLGFRLAHNTGATSYGSRHIQIPYAGHLFAASVPNQIPMPLPP